MIVCIRCGKKNDALTEPNIGAPPANPQDGDVAVCLYCAAVYRFHGADWAFVPDQVWARWPEEQRSDVTRIVLAVRLVRGHSRA